MSAHIQPLPLRSISYFLIFKARFFIPTCSRNSSAV
jgi:hypothetical protein